MYYQSTIAEFTRQMEEKNNGFVVPDDPNEPEMDLYDALQLQLEQDDGNLIFI